MKYTYKVYFCKLGKWYTRKCRSYSEAEDYFAEKMKCNLCDHIEIWLNKHCVRKYRRTNELG